MKKSKKILRPKYKIGDVVLIGVEKLDFGVDCIGTYYQVKIEAAYVTGENEYWVYKGNVDEEEVILCDEEITCLVK